MEESSDEDGAKSSHRKKAKLAKTAKTESSSAKKAAKGSSKAVGRQRSQSAKGVDVQDKKSSKGVDVQEQQQPKRKSSAKRNSGVVMSEAGNTDEHKLTSSEGPKSSSSPEKRPRVSVSGAAKVATPVRDYSSGSTPPEMTPFSSESEYTSNCFEEWDYDGNQWIIKEGRPPAMRKTAAQVEAAPRSKSSSKSSSSSSNRSSTCQTRLTNQKICHNNRRSQKSQSGG